MSADKPIQRYDNYYYEMDERAEGEYVAYSDHLDAIREARAEAFEEAAGAVCKYCRNSNPEVDVDFPSKLSHTFKNGYRPRFCAAAAIRSIIANERATPTDEPPRSYGNSYGEWQP